ncbi:MAG TPA: AraC family transcriptional regulator [Pseudogracilibacillus sp.]|nr:AraC family transcriptional regulator [Pseudogracilibacillus sp.]
MLTDQYQYQRYEEMLEDFELEEMIALTEQNVYSCIKTRQFSDVEGILEEFCEELIEMEDSIQLFVARTYFTSIISSIISTLVKKERLSNRSLVFAYRSISYIESWGTLTEYLLAIPWFVGQMKTLNEMNPFICHNPYVEKALYIIQHNIAESFLTVAWLAEELNISTTYLRNLFIIEIGQTASQYIYHKKMDEIVYELTHTNKSLKEVRDKFGFRNASHFSQYFKKGKKVTPLQFIKKHGK